MSESEHNEAGGEMDNPFVDDESSSSDIGARARSPKAASPVGTGDSDSADPYLIAEENIELTDQQAANEPVVAEVVAFQTPQYVNTQPEALRIPVYSSPIPKEFRNMSALGGAVGALVLGILSILGALITPFAFVNSVMGILMGLWGLMSRRRKMAIVGISLSVIGLAFCLFEVSMILSNFFQAREELP